MLLSSLKTVWGISSRLVHVTSVPDRTVKVAGVKAKLSILTSAPAGGAAGGAAWVVCRPARIAISIVAIAAMYKTLLVMLVPSQLKIRFAETPVSDRSSALARQLTALSQRAVDDSKRVAALDIIHVGHSEETAQLVIRHLHGPGGRRRSGLGLREGG